MSDLQNDELSGLLDGQLETRRADEVRTLIAADRALHNHFEALRRLDAQLREAAEEATFLPRISLPLTGVVGARSPNLPTSALLVAGVLLVRFIPKFVERASLSFVLPLAAMYVIGLVVSRMVREGKPVTRFPA